MYLSRSTPGVEVTPLILYSKCMSTPQRFIQNDLPYHIYNRGNRKGAIFLDTKDYQRFLRKLKEYLDKYEIRLLCYCLMRNHFHLTIIQHQEEAITKFMLSLCTSYSKYFNIKHNLVGRLFQERFRAKLVESDEYLLHLSRYIHLNPISDEIENLDFSTSTPGVEVIKMLTEYPWSSFGEYCSNAKGICNRHSLLNYFSGTRKSMSYRSFVLTGILKSDQEIIADYL